MVPAIVIVINGLSATCHPFYLTLDRNFSPSQLNNHSLTSLVVSGEHGNIVVHRAYWLLAGSMGKVFLGQGELYSLIRHYERASYKGSNSMLFFTIASMSSASHQIAYAYGLFLP